MLNPELIADQLAEAVRLVTASEFDDALRVIEHVNEQMKPERKRVSEDTTELSDPATSVGIYLAVARGEIEARDQAGALVTLNHAATAWKRAV